MKPEKEIQNETKHEKMFMVNLEEYFFEVSVRGHLVFQLFLKVHFTN